MFTLLPLASGASPQHNDINKPTRERVSKKGKNNTQQDNDKNKQQENALVKKQEEKPADKKDNITTPQPKKETAAPAPSPDTAAKPAAPKPKVRQTVDPARVQFDGIDVSKHQGHIDWGQLKEHSKIKFVYIKATEGSDYIDPRYRENIHNARKHGFKVGSYHFLSTKSSATTQFKNFITNAKREEQDLLPVIDVEVTGRWSSQQLRDSLKVFADLLEDYYGCKPLIYTSEKFFTKHLGRAFADYPLFIAKYNTTQPNIGYRWILWQFSDCGVFKPAVKGNYGEVDMSRFNKGCSINDIIYTPSKHKPKSSVRDAVDHKEKPATVNLTEQKTKEAPKMSKRQREEAQRQAEKDKKAKERSKKLAEDEAKKKAEEAKKAKEKEERLKKEKARQQAREQAAKKEADEKAKKKAAAQKEREEQAKKQAEEKAKRKAAAQKARQEKSQQQASKKTSKKSASLIQPNTSKLSQSQRNDSIRAAKNKGRKTNKSSADND